MPDLNKVFLMGRLTFDPELRRIPSGTAVTELRMATSRSWTGRDGERREETLFIDVTVWDRQAETCCQYLRKGSAAMAGASPPQRVTTSWAAPRQRCASRFRGVPQRPAWASRAARATAPVPAGRSTRPPRIR